MKKILILFSAICFQGIYPADSKKSLSEPVLPSMFSFDETEKPLSYSCQPMTEEERQKLNTLLPNEAQPDKCPQIFSPYICRNATTEDAKITVAKELEYTNPLPRYGLNCRDYMIKRALLELKRKGQEMKNKEDIQFNESFYSLTQEK